MIYITFQINPTEYLKGMGYQTKKFAVACEDDIDYFKVGMDLASLEGISYLRVRHSKPHGRIILPATNYAKDIHL